MVSYSIRVKVNCGTLGGDVSADLPFKLVHSGQQSTTEPGTSKLLMRNRIQFLSSLLIRNKISKKDFFLVGSEDQHKEKNRKLTKGKSRDVANYEGLCYGKDADDDEGNIIFEDFAKLRMSMSDMN